MKIINWLLEPLRDMFDRLATTDQMAIDLRALGWSRDDLEAVRMFAQMGGTAEDLSRAAHLIAKYPHD